VFTAMSVNLLVVHTYELLSHRPGVSVIRGPARLGKSVPYSASAALAPNPRTVNAYFSFAHIQMVATIRHVTMINQVNPSFFFIR